MLFSENKLRELASLSANIKTEEILNAINSIGFEVESCQKFTNVHGIKFGHVLKTYKNKDSNNLNVCEIEFNDKKRTIQTTANNVKEGDYLIAFIPGSGINKVIFDAKKIQGIISEGMLTSLDELGFDGRLMREEWKDGIFIFDKISLDKDPIIELDLNDNIIDITILTNRSDANSYLVMALELAAYFNTKPISLPNFEQGLETKIKMESIGNNYITGVEVATDNFKLNIKDIILLLKSNIKLENNINDLASLILIMTGVSARIYNSEKIEGKISLSIEKNIEFNNLKIPKSLVVKDNKNILSIAGILESAIFKSDDGNKKVLFEFASFDSKEIRESSRILKITNQSSINSSKEVSHGSIEFAIKFMATKIKNCSQPINKQINIEGKTIEFDEKYLNKYAGFDLIKSPKYLEVIKSLNILGFKIIENKIQVPAYRHDIENMQDIVEEIFRFYGLNNFDEKQPTLKFQEVSNNKDLALMCAFLGYIQFWTYTLVNRKQNNFNPFSFEEKISLLTYISEEHNSIRNSLAPSLEENYNYNKKRKIDGFHFFDIGMINKYQALCIASDTKTYSQLKSDIFKIYGKELEVKALNFDFLHPNYNAGLFDNKKQVGWIGKMHPKDTTNNLIFAEIIIDQKLVNNNKFQEYDSAPLKERDLTIPLQENESIEKHIIKIKKITGIFEIKEKECFLRDNVRYLTLRIKMNDAALQEFDKKFNI